MPSQPFTDAEIVAAFPEMSIHTPHLGIGGQKVAFRAKDGSNDVALKVFLTADGGSSEEAAIALERFRRELDGMAAISSPHVVHLLRGPDTRLIGRQRYHWYTEPHMSGGVLRTRLDSGPVSSADVFTLTESLLLAVEAMWEQRRVVHRDIKPENIGYKADGTVVLLDLGIALFADQSDLTETNLVGPGSNRYAAPEQFVPRHGVTIDFRTDLFQVGVVVAEAALGHHPFYTRGTDYLESIRTFDTKMLSSTSIDDGVRRVLPRLLAANPSGRYRKVSLALSSLRGEF